MANKKRVQKTTKFKFKLLEDEKNTAELEKDCSSKITFFPIIVIVTSRFWPSCRMALAISGCLGSVLIFMLRVNLSFALTCMVKPLNTTEEINATVVEDECTLVLPPPKESMAEFDWSRELQGFMISAFFYGYISTLLLVGYLAVKYGGKVVVIWGCLGMAVVSVFAPPAARLDPILLIVLRVLLGMFSAVYIPCTTYLISYWAPPFELGTISSIVVAGAYIGEIAAFPVSGLLCVSGIDNGWPLIFYVFGALLFVWCVLAYFTIYDDPYKHPYISDSERRYLMANIAVGRREKHPIPWKSILKSRAFWAVVVTHYANDWGFYMLALCLPLYMKDVLRFDIEMNGLLLALPNLATFVMSLATGQVLDYLVMREMCSVTVLRKMANGLGLTLSALFLAMVPFISCERRYLVIVIIIVGQSLLTISFTGGFIMNYIDLAPAFSGILMSLGNTISSTSGIIVPSLTGFVTTEGTRAEWSIVFFTTSVLLFLASFQYFFFGEGTVQPWAQFPVEEKREPSLTSAQSLIFDTLVLTSGFYDQVSLKVSASTVADFGREDMEDRAEDGL